MLVRYRVTLMNSTSSTYNRMNDNFEAFLKKMPGSKSLIRLGSKWKRETKRLLRFLVFLLKPTVFATLVRLMGMTLKQLEHYLNLLKRQNSPYWLHILTTKGKGYEVAIKNPERFHGASPYDIGSGMELATGAAKQNTKISRCYG